MRVSELVKDWTCDWIKGDFHSTFRSIQNDSRLVQNGDIFIAIRGVHYDGHDYVQEAIKKGACAIFVDTCYNDLIDGDYSVCVVPNTTSFYAHAAAIYYGNPSRNLKVIAVTGTNGKTTTCSFIAQLLHLNGLKVANIGTNGCFINGQLLMEAPQSMTTWDAMLLQKTIAMCLNKSVTHIVLEASSVGLAQYRLDSCDIDIGVGLAISHDHIDEHGSFGAYLKAKERLVALSSEIVANGAEDFWCKSQKKYNKAFTFFYEEEWEVLDETIDSMKVLHKPSKLEVTCPFSGAIMRANIVAAVTVLQQLRIPLQTVASNIPLLTLPEGRFSVVHRDFTTVIVDYAHTPAALQGILTSISEKCEGKIIIVFGCGGNRDKRKRPMMGEIAETWADIVIITSDNPRQEDVTQICNEIVGNNSLTDNYLVIEDRKQAITTALNLASTKDIVLIVGKGHEKFQQIGSNKIPFSDVEVVQNFYSV